MKLSSSFLVDKPSYNAPVSSLLVTEKTRKRVKDFLIFQKQEILLVNQHKKTGFKKQQVFEMVLDLTVHVVTDYKHYILKLIDMYLKRILYTAFL